MLSRKQLWRKLKSRSNMTPYFSNGNDVDGSLKNNDSYTTTGSTNSSSDFNSSYRLSNRSLNTSSYTTKSSSGSNSDISRTYKIKKSVRFSLLVKVCLIPTRSELSHISSEIYWNCEECEGFKQQAFCELRDYADQFKVTIKQAIIALYQPCGEGQENDEDFYYELIGNSSSSNSNAYNNGEKEALSYFTQVKDSEKSIETISSSSSSSSYNQSQDQFHHHHQQLSNHNNNTNSTNTAATVPSLLLTKITSSPISIDSVTSPHPSYHLNIPTSHTVNSMSDNNSTTHVPTHMSSPKYNTIDRNRNRHSSNNDGHYHHSPNTTLQNFLNYNNNPSTTTASNSCSSSSSLMQGEDMNTGLLAAITEEQSHLDRESDFGGTGFNHLSSSTSSSAFNSSSSCYLEYMNDSDQNTNMTKKDSSDGNGSRSSSNSRRSGCDEEEVFHSSSSVSSSDESTDVSDDICSLLKLGKTDVELNKNSHHHRHNHHGGESKTGSTSGDSSKSRQASSAAATTAAVPIPIPPPAVLYVKKTWDMPWVGSSADRSASCSSSSSSSSSICKKSMNDIASSSVVCGSYINNHRVSIADRMAPVLIK